MIHATKIDTTFIMPPEVATRLLLNKKISNKTRKRALLARSTRQISYAPIVPDGPHSAFYDTKAAKTPAYKLVRKYAALPLAKLQRIPLRCQKLRLRLQREYQRTEELKARQQLDLLAQRVDLMCDSAEAELAYREALSKPKKTVKSPAFSISAEAIAEAQKSL